MQIVNEWVWLLWSKGSDSLLVSRIMKATGGAEIALAKHHSYETAFS